MLKIKTTHIDANGRLVLPVEFRKAWGLSEEDLVTVYMENGKIIIEKAIVNCQFCGCANDLVRFYAHDNHFFVKDVIRENDFVISRKKDVNEHCICLSCLKKLKDM